MLSCIMQILCLVILTNKKLVSFLHLERLFYTWLILDTPASECVKVKIYLNIKDLLEDFGEMKAHNQFLIA